MIITNGRLTSGICSTRRRAYEKRPSTVMPTITIVAKTGFLIEMRVISIRASAVAVGLVGGRVSRRSRRAHQRRRAVFQIVEPRRQHGQVGRQRRLDLDQAVVVVT